ncbi:MAG: O-antigen ligase family protein [Clostridiales bacterium]|nr:O-antigen ligase family protein [Candidatus Equinaster intestinalis]
MKKSLKTFNLGIAIEKLLIFFYCSLMILPYYSKNMNLGIVIILCAFLCAFAIGRNIPDVNVSVLLLLVLSLYMAVSYYRASDTTKIGNLFANILFYFPMIVFVQRTNDNSLDFLWKWFIILQSYVAIVNIKALIEDPNVQKYVTGGVTYDKYKLTNIGTIGTVFASVILIIMACYILKNFQNIFYKILAIAAIVINSVYVITAGSFINLIALCIGIIAFFYYVQLKSVKSKLLAIFLGFMLLVLFILFIDYIGDLVSNISGINQFYQTRLKDLFSYSSGGGGETLSGRIDRYILSVKTFCRVPIFGVGMVYDAEYTRVGMHSEVFDFAARYGIVGIVFLVLLLKEFFANQKNQMFFGETGSIKQYMPIFICIIVYGIFNPLIGTTSGMAIFLVIPSLLFNIERIKKETKNNMLKEDL